MMVDAGKSAPNDVVWIIDQLITHTLLRVR